jgi:Protein of unknown function (DUF1572)
MPETMRGMALKFTASPLEDAVEWFRFYKKKAESAMAQVTDGELTATLDPEMNSIALLVKHLSGNMRSRWRDFPLTDGEKPDRDRDSEFLDPPAARDDLMALWESGWRQLFAALETLTDADLGREAPIRGETHSVLQAIHREMTHYAYHCGQIVFLAKHFRSSEWKSLSIPRGQSPRYTPPPTGTP